MVVGGVSVAPTFAAPATVTVAFSGQAGTAVVGGALYAKEGATVTLTVNTSADTQCVDVAGAFTGHQQSDSPRSSWTFIVRAGAGDSVQSVTATASVKFNNNNICTGASVSGQASYTLDNTGPVIASALAPTPNAAGWHNDDVTVKWTATDAGSGVATAQPFKTESVSSNGITALTASAQSDRLGNAGAAGSVTVRVDMAAPAITASQTKNADGTTTVTFTCDDSNSGGGQSSGIATCLADGSTTNSKTVQPGVTVTGTATDKAGNTATTSSTAPAGDTTAPLLAGAPTTQPNGNGWYKGDVTVRWTASDPESGIPTAPADTTITAEGKGLTSSQTVKNGAGLTTAATSSPAVNIDRTAPTTGISGTSNDWTNGNVTVTLAATDNLSMADKTTYTIDGGAAQNGTSFTLSTEGDHTVTYFSTDKAGNAEAVQTAHVKIDRTAPTISHAFTPLSYKDGVWTNQDVTVTFTCADQGGSGLASCTSPIDRTAETDVDGAAITGTATDGAGNSATDTATVRIDKTKPTITAKADREPNAAGWYKDDVTVSYSANDALSGVSGSPKADVLGEGKNQSASATVTDAAGNSATAGVTGINVDKTAPVLSASYTSGWHTGDVKVAWSCTDPLSGVATGPADDTVSGEGDNLSSTASCTDVAGNTATKTVTGIKIDRTAPTTTASVPDGNDADWYGDAVKVTLSSSDNGSGIATTYYSVDNGAAKTYVGPFSYGTEGTHHIFFWSVDNAGNVETAGTPITLRIDTTAPTTDVVNPISLDGGWFVKSGIPFAFAANDSGSGVAATYYTIDGEQHTYGEPFTADLSTGTHHVTYWSVDLAGNPEKAQSFDVKVDTVPPSITGDTVNADGSHRAANAAGWFNSPVDVKFTCDDVGSGLQTGVAGCAGDTTLSNDGAGQKVHGDAVDVAGNHSGTDVTGINIDKTKPTLVGVPPDLNGAGWYKGDVTVNWVGDDALSGIDTSSQPGNSTITGEGSNLSAGPVRIKDKAGNVSDPASVSGIKIDRTAPVITGAPTTQPNTAGWFTSAVTVDFKCSDPDLADGSKGSGVAVCPTSKLLKGDGANQSVTSDTATDVAGNVAAAKTVGGINIDGTAPSTTSNNQCTATNGYCTGSSAEVVLTATDQPGLSGVKEIHYSIDGGTEQVAAGATKTVSVPLTGSGAGTVKYWAVDNAGNVEAANSVALKWDNIAPTVTHALSPVPNADEWNNADVTVTFTAKDDDKGSGVASVSGPVTVSTETAGQVVTGTAKDTAGNIGTDSVTVKLDKTRPTITGAVTSGAKGSNGWYVGPVTVTFTCGDALSGVAICPDAVVLSTNGANTATGTVTDKAGNTATATVSGINIDQEKPALTTADVNVQGGTYTLGSVPAATCTATDSISGVDACKVSVSGGNANGVGTFTYTATATDKAGNATRITGSYKVIYRWDGFLQPINDTAHQVGASTSIFKAGSTVPAKFQLKKADGTVVQAVAAPAWLSPVKGSATSAPVDESVYTASADSGSDYKYDATAQQYNYNWKTPSAGGNYYRIGVTFDDGQTYYVNIGLR
ncbi:hypothetical protein N864_03055 [Intrasporangium chromatireducens Q5-1]|uniref:Uncharacterized protein n=1 Tax=Intrasporangium chromatireducens Q5-1 TaxID=584657 RepID=W9GP55_9MICO|nr:hypothetical protein N864_03055 [Intrasporangium chromatireducens Q5-1]